MIKNTRFKQILAVLILVFGFFMPTALNALAEGYKFALTPMNQKIIINPGESYKSSFQVVNPSTDTTDVEYNVKLDNFYVDENHATVFEEVGGTGEILDWISFESPVTGILKPGESADVAFTVNVPSNAAAGGQYAAFVATANAISNNENTGKNTNQTEENDNGTMIEEIKSIAHLLYAEVTGDTIRQGEILDISVPNFILSGDIFGSSSIKNNGNVHGTAYYKLQVFPLFSNEEIYTNEEDPASHEIMPDRVLYNETKWDQTPNIGIFNVIYTVEFEGATAQVSRMVIKCPIWLLFIIIFAIFALIFYFIAKSKARKKAAKTSQTK